MCVHKHILYTLTPTTQEQSLRTLFLVVVVVVVVGGEGGRWGEEMYCVCSSEDTSSA